MNAEELWNRSGLTGEYSAWAFGEAPDKLADLVMRGIKTATCSSYDVYQAQQEPLPVPGEYSVILNAEGEAVCIIQTTKVAVTEFSRVTEEHAYKEGEGDRSLEYWRDVHEAFLKQELKPIHKPFSDSVKVVCEEFQLVYPKYDSGN